MIRLKHIYKSYKLGEMQLPALVDVNLHVKPHEFVSILGPSGSGKSTLMNIIGCLDVPDSGDYILDGSQIGNCTEDELSEIRGKKIGFIFQQFNLLPDLTAYENVSGGQQQRVAIARVLASQPSIILADEPTGNLDSASGREIMEIIKGLWRDGNTIILITHDIHVADQAERKVYVHDGRLSDKETAV